jgi:hypothetical protein
MHKVAINSKTTEAREKLGTGLESLEFSKTKIQKIHLTFSWEREK